MTVKLLSEQHLEFLRLYGGYTGSSGSINVKMLHCWKSHDAAQIMNADMKTHAKIWTTIPTGNVSMGV